MFSTHEPEQASGVGEETIVLVHGTFAWKDKPYGSDWWQLWPDGEPQPADASFAAFLKKADGKRFMIAPSPWPKGENSERIRRKSGKRLLALLRELDRSGRKFHVIAHSHGGSVVWHALCRSVSAPLSNLQSWITVATPFLAHRSAGFNWASAVGLLVAVLACVSLLPRAFDLLDSLAQVQANAPWWALAIASFLLLVLVAGCLVFAWLGIRPLVCWLITASPRWTSSPILQNLVFGTHTE